MADKYALKLCVQPTLTDLFSNLDFFVFIVQSLGRDMSLFRSTCLITLITPSTYSINHQQSTQGVCVCTRDPLWQLTLCCVCVRVCVRVYVTLLLLITVFFSCPPFCSLVWSA